MVAGMVAGLAGLTVFLLIHQAWIVPIWFIAPMGAIMASLGGAAVGASYGELQEHLPHRPWRAFAVAAIYAGVLVPAVVFAEFTGPIFVMAADGGGRLTVPGSVAMADVAVGLLGATALSGAILGAWIGRTRRASALCALAGLALAVGPGHNIPLLGGTAAVAKELTIIGVALVVASVVLVEVDARLAPRRHATQPTPTSHRR